MLLHAIYSYCENTVPACESGPAWACVALMSQFTYIWLNDTSSGPLQSLQPACSQSTAEPAACFQRHTLPWKKTKKKHHSKKNGKNISFSGDN